MDHKFTHDLGPCVIEWNQPQLGSAYAATWHCRLLKPFESINFGYVAQTIHGTWFASLFPKGRGIKPDFHAPYVTPEKAVNQIERWARYHWRVVPERNCETTWSVKSGRR